MTEPISDESLAAIESSPWICATAEESKRIIARLRAAEEKRDEYSNDFADNGVVPNCDYDELRAKLGRAEAALPHDLREKGWAVAVHNDYRVDGVRHTFWLMTKDGRCAKGEGRTDAEALTLLRAAIRKCEIE